MGNETQAWPGGARPAVLAAGVHLPFTAPLLTGARGRLRGRTIDFILPNPSGGRGAYVAVWSMVRDLAGPTVHDAILSRRLQALPSLTPCAVRDLSRAVAAEGYAGRAAATAATRAQAATDGETLRLWAMLLMALIRASPIPAAEHTMVLVSLGSAGPGHVTEGFTALSQRLGWNTAQLAEALQQVSTAFVPIARNGRMRRLLAMLASLQSTLVEEHSQHFNTASRPAAVLARTIRCVGHCLHKAGALLDVATLALDEPPVLLERWRFDPAAALSPVTALEEMLDGWDRICLLWHDAATLSARLDLLPEIALLTRLAAENNPAASPDVAAGSTPASPAVSAAASATIPAPDRQDVIGADRKAEAAEIGGPREAPPAVIVERNERIRALELGLDDGHG